ncbi:hypothetical protein QG37_00656 [Candidozyma auris]|uniref:Uncharacterized protein n=1 Tax=Candidozyma auris TaxID=498019 RepID=A0A0L0P7Q0_CANAR|nr:hypothetical protein QG37_00656 [[Candida] auris]
MKKEKHPMTKATAMAFLPAKLPREIQSQSPKTKKLNDWMSR